MWKRVPVYNQLNGRLILLCFSGVQKGIQFPVHTVQELADRLFIILIPHINISSHRCPEPAASD